MNPFFSFIIPTKNRSFYLKHAIQSCLNQSFSDFEIIVSDNNSTDDTEEVVKSFNDKRIKYYNTKIDLSVANSFDNGIKYCRGKYLLYLADDESYISDTLLSLKKIFDYTSVDVVSFGRKANYIHSHNADRTIKKKNNSNTLTVEPFSNKVLKLNSNKLLSKLISCEAVYYGIATKQDYFYSLRAYPLTVKCAINRKLVEKIIKKYGYFHYRAPDWSACVFTLLNTKNIVLYDRHLNLSGVLPNSNGPMYRETGFFGDVPSTEEYKTTICPLDLPLFTNILFDTIFDAYLHENKTNELLKYINFEKYIGCLIRDLYTWKINNVNTHDFLNIIINFCKKKKIDEHNNFLKYFEKNKKYDFHFIH